ncbi:zinc finger protein 829-like [Discoglossus pictus]
MTTKQSSEIHMLNGEGQSEFDGVAVYFSKEEWDSLKEDHKELYKDVMMENYQNLKYLGYGNVKPTVISNIEQGVEPYQQVEDEKMTRDVIEDGSTSCNTSDQQHNSQNSIHFVIGDIDVTRIYERAIKQK